MLKVKEIKDYIVEITGKNNLMINEVVEFDNGTRGIVMKAKRENAFVALFDQTIDNPLAIGSVAKATKNEFKIKISEKMIGNIINVNGDILSDFEHPEGVIRSTEIEERDAFRLARPIYTRDFVNQPLVTGVAAVDWAIPIGMGQRELILGDRQTGKTSIAMNSILAQKETKVFSIYVAIGQKRSTILDFYNRLKEFGLLERSIIVASSANQPATQKWLAPYVGVTIAEYLQEKYGDDVLMIYDDLSKHADAYRELSLLMKSAPAREAYPGDIFYLHSKLLERAGKFNEDFGGGSITALPIVQTEAGDITSYIPTNVISITDGQIFTSKTLFNAGQRPAIDIPYSVSRVGSTAQTKALSKMASGMKLQVSSYEEAMKMTRLSGTVSEENRETIDSGRVLTALLVQPEFDVMKQETGVLLLSLYKRGYLNFYRDASGIKNIKRLLDHFLENDYIGKSLKRLILNHDIDSEKFDLINNQIILPLIKYQIIKEDPEVAKEERFIEIFNKIRNDGIMYVNLQRSVKGDDNGIN